MNVRCVSSGRGARDACPRGAPIRPGTWRLGRHRIGMGKKPRRRGGVVTGREGAHHRVVGDDDVLADHQRRSLHQDVARGLDLVGLVPEPGRARLLEGVSPEHRAKRQCVRRAPRGPGDRGGVRKRPRRDRRGHLASLARIDTTPRTSRQSTRRDATARARSRLCARPRRRFRTWPGSEKGAKREPRLEKLCERWRSKLHAVLPSLLTMRMHDAGHDAPETSM
jgi:hypothetical protein